MRQSNTGSKVAVHDVRLVVFPRQDCSSSVGRPKEKFGSPHSSVSHSWVTASSPSSKALSTTLSTLSRSTVPVQSPRTRFYVAPSQQSSRFLLSQCIIGSAPVGRQVSSGSLQRSSYPFHSSCMHMVKGFECGESTRKRSLEF